MNHHKMLNRPKAGAAMRFPNFIRWGWWMMCFLPIAIIYIGCGEDLTPEDTTPPGKPMMIPKTPESQFLQQGIDSEAGITDQDYWIRIEWDWNTEPDLMGYYVYRMDERDSLGNYEYVKIRNLQLGVDLRREIDAIPYYIDQSSVLRPDPVSGFSHGFYYYVRAFDNSGNVSAPSDTVYYRLLQKPRGLTINGNIAAAFNFVWEYYALESWNYFFIRVSPEALPDNRVWSYRADLLVTPFVVTFNSDGSANRDYFRGESDSLIAGNYSWMVDVVADFDPIHPAGAETKATFTVQP